MQENRMPICTSGTYISISFKGITGLKSHLCSDKHCRTVKEASSSTKVINYFVTTDCETEDEATVAESTYAIIQL